MKRLPTKRLYACIVSDHSKEELLAVARQFAYGVELLEDAVLFDITGTETLFGTTAEIAARIQQALNGKSNIAIAYNAAAALLHARNQPGISIVEENSAVDLPLSALDIEPHTLEIFHALGLKTSADVNRIDDKELIARYGAEFKGTIDLAKNKADYVLTPNLKENNLSWHSELDFKVDDFEQLIFIVASGLEKILNRTAEYGLSTEHIDIDLRLDNRTSKPYQVKLSFPTLNKKFWLTIINLRIGNDPPGAEITALRLTAHFTRPRSVQRGLFASAKPEPENLQLTADKIKRLVGDENVGVPVLLDRRLPKPFKLDQQQLPLGNETLKPTEVVPMLALNYFDPPLAAEVVVNKKILLYLRTSLFEGRVVEYGGVWKSSSQWWSLLDWRNLEWDIELEDRSLYRLQRSGREWFVIGKYD
jgi:protein ImuB